MAHARRYWHGGWVAVVLWCAGCAEELGPERWPTTRVVGVVREGARPVRGGWIEFAPIDGTVGNLRTAPIEADGSFTAVGVAVGLNRISLAHTSADPRLSRLFLPGGIRLDRTIPPGRQTSLTIDLVDEALRRQREAEPGD